MKKHINIPIFIPHLGCPNQCVFCNQRTISGVCEFHISDVKRKIEDCLSTVAPNVDTEIAFFGGSFTGIDRNLMISLLELAFEYIKSGRIKSIRCSTRPDYINNEILDILERYSVKTIELGLQSCDDHVLEASKRGHDYHDEETACRLIVDRGFELVGQMMIGLPGSTLENEIKTAQFIINSGAMGARIYPTVVFKETELCNMTKLGMYVPLALDDAIERSVTVLKMFNDARINVIRIGLCASENLSDDEKYYAGPNHPSLGEMVEAELYYREIKRLITYPSNKVLYISVAKGALSKAIGNKKCNKMRIIREYGFSDIKFKEDETLNGYEIKIDVEGKKECT